MSAIDTLKKKIDLDDIEYALLHYFLFSGESHAERADKAASEYAAIRARVEQAERERDSKADSLNAWAELWAHVVKRLGGDDGTLPTTANFDALAESATLAPRRCGTCNPLKPEASS